MYYNCAYGICAHYGIPQCTVPNVTNEPEKKKDIFNINILIQNLIGLMKFLQNK